MDDIFKRLVIAYLGFTAALWAISLGMVANGSASPKNYAWVIVTSLRFYFTLPLAAALVFAAGAGLFWAVLADRECRQRAVKTRVRAEEERFEAEERKQRAEERKRQEAEAMRPRTEEKKRLDAGRAAQWLARKEEEAAEAKQREEERQRQKIIEKQLRSARNAAERALDDF